MKSMTVLGSCLGILLSLGIATFLLTNSGSAKTNQGEVSDNSLQQLNKSAKAARSGDAAAIQDYVAGIIQVSGFENELRGQAAEEVKARVGRAESRFRIERTGGIPEARVAATVNALVYKFKLPEYSKTNLYEVRKLRAGLLADLPQTITQDNSNGKAAAEGAEITAELSPAEAFFVLTTLFQQKLSNPEYQVTHAERLQDWDKTHNHDPNARQEARVSTAGRSGEVQDALRRGFLSSPESPLQLIDKTLNTLGVEK